MALLSFVGSPHGGRQRLLPEWNTQPTITATTIIDHSIVGSAEGAYLHFRDNTGVESHFIIDLDGEIWQLMDTGREADANLEANAYAISIETADNGDPDNFRWTTAQFESLVWLHNKLRQVHPTIDNKEGIGCTSPGRRGHSYHTRNGAPSCWTPVAKSCPGNIRKTQWRDENLPAYLSGPLPTPGPLEDTEMFLLRCDTPARVPQLVVGQYRVNLTNQQRIDFKNEGVQEFNFTDRVDLFDLAKEQTTLRTEAEFSQEERDTLARLVLLLQSGQGNQDFPGDNALVQSVMARTNLDQLQTEHEASASQNSDEHAAILSAVTPPPPTP